METYSDTIGRFAGGLRLADVPPAVVEKAKLVFLDTLGIALASSTMDFGLMAVNVARKLSGPKASLLIGTSDRVAAANAVMANGTLAHGLDYDDTLVIIATAHSLLSYNRRSGKLLSIPMTRKPPTTVRWSSSF